MLVAEGTTVTIADTGKPVRLDYAGALAAHRGDSWFGLAAGFRMLQAVGQALSRERLWERGNLAVVSGHPGNGVRDAVDYVTGCVTRGCYDVTGGAGPGCSRAMRFAWAVDDGRQRATAIMDPGLVPEELFQLLDRRGSAGERDTDARRFAALKQELAERLWAQPLARSFQIELQAAGATEHA